MRIIDIHTHIAPNIDDGSQSIKESIQMIKRIIKQGGTDIVLTPHSDCVLKRGILYTNEQITRLKKEVDKKKIPIQIYTGNEIYVSKKTIEFIIKALNNKELYSINDSRFILIEFSPYLESFEQILYCINIFLVNNWLPIIAHVERLNSSIRTKENIDKLKKKGCKIQINYYSLVEETDIKIKQFAKELINNELVDFLGSDSHSIYHRPPIIKSGIDYIKSHCNSNYADRILWKNAEEYFLL